MSEYPSWVKPHLRQRLEEERLAREPKKTDGLTPTGTTFTPTGTTQPSAQSIGRGLRRVPGARLQVGDIVTIRKPDDLDNEMDRYVGIALTVAYMWDECGSSLFKVREDNREWSYCESWII